jgi:beta-galactosidase
MPMPGLLRDVMGVTLKDYAPIYGDKVGVKFGAELPGADGECATWADLLRPTTAKVLATYTGAYEGDAAITANAFGKGKAVYVGADLDAMSLARVLRTLLAMTGSKSEIAAPRGVEVTRRRTAGKEWVFLLNHTAEAQKVAVAGKFKSVLSGDVFDGSVTMKAFDVVVMHKA